MNTTTQIHKCYFCYSENTKVIKEENDFLPSGPTTSYINKCNVCKAGEAISKKEYLLRLRTDESTEEEIKAIIADYENPEKEMDSDDFLALIKQEVGML